MFRLDASLVRRNVLCLAISDELAVWQRAVLDFGRVFASAHAFDAVQPRPHVSANSRGGGMPGRTPRRVSEFVSSAALVGLVCVAASDAAAQCFPGQRCIVAPRVQMQPRVFLQPRMAAPGMSRDMRQFGNQARVDRPMYRPGRMENGRIVRGEGQRFYSTTRWYMVPSGIGNAGPAFDIEAFIDSLMPDGSIPTGDDDQPAPEGGE